MLRAASLILALSLGPALALACSCKPAPPPRKSLEMSTAVFSGKCVDVALKGGVLHCTFEVDRVWKGEIGAKVVVYTARDDGECGYDFTTKGDATYLLYCYKSGDGLETNICTRTRTLAAAKDDLKELGDGAKPKAEKKKE